MKLATMTLFAKGDDNPAATICPGHVTPEVFNQAFNEEGWSEHDPFTKDELRHEYWVKKKNGAWRKATPETKGAQPVTVMDW